MLEKWIRRLGMPEDIISSMPVLELRGDIQMHKHLHLLVHITNYNGIAELTSEQIRIALRDGEYIIEGKQLYICEATHREIVIGGMITGIRIQNAQRLQNTEESGYGDT